MDNDGIRLHPSLKAVCLLVLDRKEREIVQAIEQQPETNNDTARRLLAKRHAYIREARRAIEATDKPPGDDDGKGSVPRP